MSYKGNDGFDSAIIAGFVVWLICVAGSVLGGLVLALILWRL